MPAPSSGAPRAAPAIRTRETLGLALGLIAVLLFAGSLPATRYAVATLDPIFVASARAAASGLLAAAVLIVMRCPLPRPGEWRPMLGNTFVAVIGFPVFSSLAMTTVPAAHGGVVLGLMPLVTTVFAVWLAGERPSIAFWLWGLAGAGLIVAFTLLRHSGSAALVLGDLYLLVAMVATTLGYVLGAQLSLARPSWEVQCWSIALGLPWSLPVTALLWPENAGAIGADTIGIDTWAAVLYVGLVAQLIAFFFWNAGLAIGGISRVSQIQLLQTFATIVIAAFINGERIEADVFVFAVAVALVVLFGRRARVRR